MGDVVDIKRQPKRACAVCGHKQREEIDKALQARQRGENGSLSVREIGAKYDVHYLAVQRHKGCVRRETREVSQKLVADQKARRELNIIDHIEAMYRTCWNIEQASIDLKKQGQRILDEAKAKGDLRTQLVAIGTMNQTIAGQTRIIGELREGMKFVLEAKGQITKDGAVVDVKPAKADDDYDDITIEELEHQIAVAAEILRRRKEEAERGMAQ